MGAAGLYPTGRDTAHGGSHVPGTNVAHLSPLSVRVKQACHLIGIGRSQLYELIAAGEIETIKVGAATLVAMASLARFIEARRDAS